MFLNRNCINKNRISLSFTLLTFTISILFSFHAISCSSFLMEADSGHPIFSKSYDWKIPEGYIVVNPRGLNKKSLSLDTSEKINWISKYSSISFNQYGAEFPNGGMNEKGLMVEILWLDQSSYEVKDQRPVLNELQWIQYQLDQHANTKEVVKNLNKIRIQNIYAKVHYLVCDKTKTCSTIEYINGKTEVHTGSTLPFHAITNSTYVNSKDYLLKYEGFGGTEKIPMLGYNSLDRFVRINHLVKNYSNVYDPIEYAYSILNSVRKTGYTQWQIVYQPTEGTVYFRTTFITNVTGFIQATDLFSGCKKERMYFDLHTPLRGQVTNFFKPLTIDDNKKLITTTFGKLMGNPPNQLVEAISAAPFKMSCSL